MMIIEHYEGRGIVMGDWSDEILRDPRSALQQLKKNEHRFEERLDCIDNLLSIDTSFEGKEEVDARIGVLKELDVGMDVLENTRELIETFAKRGARHRIMLDQDWKELVAQGKADESMPTASFNLQEYEDEIGLLYLFISGFIGIIAMILPGISGAYILIILGAYSSIIGLIKDVLSALTTSEIDIFIPALSQLTVFALGTIVGMRIFASILKWLFDKEHDKTMSVLIGLMIGALHKIWPWQEKFKMKRSIVKTVTIEDSVDTMQDFTFVKPSKK